MKKLLLIGIDTSTADALTYAKSKGVYTIITDFSDKNSSPLKAMADENWNIDVKDLDALEKRCKKENISHIYAGSQELCLDSCKQLSERLGVPFYASEEGWRAARDKELYKNYCQKAGLDVPHKYWIGGDPPRETLEEILFPVVVKPNDGNAKRGFSIVNSKEELWPAIKYALAFSSQKKILIEEYIQGILVSVLCCIYNGKLKLLDNLVMLPDTMDGRRAFTFGIHESHCNADVVENLLPAYEKIVQEMNSKQGPIIFQSILRDRKYYQLEIGYRLDGICSWRYTERLIGISSLKYRVDLALDEVSNKGLPGSSINAGKEICVGVVFWGKAGQISSIKGKQELYSRPDIVVHWDRFKEGDIIPDTDDMTSIALFIEVFGTSHYEIGKKLKEINNTLHYYNETGEDLLIYHDNLFEKWKEFQQK